MPDRAGEAPKPPRKQGKTTTTPEKTIQGPTKADPPPRPEKPPKKRPKPKKTQAQSCGKRRNFGPWPEPQKERGDDQARTLGITVAKNPHSSYHPPSVTPRVCSCARTGWTRRQSGCKRISGTTAVRTQQPHRTAQPPEKRRTAQSTTSKRPRKPNEAAPNALSDIKSNYYTTHAQ